AVAHERQAATSTPVAARRRFTHERGGGGGWGLGGLRGPWGENINWMREGSPMGAFFFCPAGVAAPPGLVAAPPWARLCTASGLALRAAPCLFGTSFFAVNIPTVAAGADQHLNVAARTKIEARVCQSLVGVATETWTNPLTGEIIPRHACSARCGARRRCQLA